ncbi:hypothetical protein F5B17DRAFT_410799 [Nemania serpens]|nr:hypothetical protein F5B17DRAFT_410799 [Nemania serpens]
MKAETLLRRLPTPNDWVDRAVRHWEHDIFPRLIHGLHPNLNFAVAKEDFKDRVRIPYHRWVKDGKLPFHSEEVESIMEFYVQQAVSAIREQVSKLRESGHPANYICITGGFGENEFIRSHISQVAETCGVRFVDEANRFTGVKAVSRGAILYGLYLLRANRRSGPGGQKSDVMILIGSNHITILRKGELAPQHTFKRIPINGNLMQNCFQHNIGSYKLNLYSTSLSGTLASTACIIWQQFQREVTSDDVCVLEIRLHSELGDGSLTSLIHSARVAMFVNGVKQGRAQLSYQ